MRYRRRQDIEVEAYQLTRRNIDSVSHLCGGRIRALPVPTSPPNGALLRLDVPTLEGVKRACLGGWVVRDARMEWDVLTDDEFDDQFEAVEEGLTPLVDEDKMRLAAVHAVYEDMRAAVRDGGYYYTGMEVSPWLRRLRLALGLPYVEMDEDDEDGLGDEPVKIDPNTGLLAPSLPEIKIKRGGIQFPRPTKENP